MRHEYDKKFKEIIAKAWSDPAFKSVAVRSERAGRGVWHPCAGGLGDQHRRKYSGQDLRCLAIQTD